MDVTSLGPHGGPKEETRESSAVDPRLKEYQKWIRSAEHAKDKADKWAERGDKLFRGYGKKDSGLSEYEDDEKDTNALRSLRKINRLRRKINASVNQCYSRNPTFVGSPKRPVMVPDDSVPPQFDPMTGMQLPPPMVDISGDIADVVSEIMANVFMESSLKSEAKSAIRESHHRPAAIIQVGYQYDDRQGVDDIYFRRRSFEQFLIDPDAQVYDGEVRRCRFMALRWDLTKHEAESMGLDWSALSDKENMSADEDPKGAVFQVWDKQNNILAWVPRNGDKFAAEPTAWPWEIDGFPFEIIKLTEDADKQWSKPLILEAEGLQAEMDVMREEITVNVVYSRPMTLYDSSLLSEEEAGEMAGRNQLGWKPIKGLSQFPNAIQSVNTEALSPEFFQHYMRCDAEMNEVLGTSSMSMLRASKNTSATEVSKVSGAEDSVISEKTDIITDSLNRLSRKAIQIMKQTYTTERVTQITNPNGEKTWIRWIGSQVLQEVDVTVETGSIERENTETKRQVDLNMLQTMTPIPGLDILKLAVDTLKSFGKKNPEAYRLQPITAPMGPTGGVGPQQPGMSQMPSPSPVGGSGPVLAGIRNQMNPMR